MSKNKNRLSPQQSEELLTTLQMRFEQNRGRHNGLEWAKVLAKLEASPAKLWTLDEMEITGGEPDVVCYDAKIDAFIFFDCCGETPKDRRSFCYDHQALESRKANKPENSAVNKAADMGIELLSEDEYQHLQKLGNFDLKTSCWLKTPEEIREVGGAIFGDRRFGKVFIYHNGAESYYAGRGFRGSLRV